MEVVEVWEMESKDVYAHTLDRDDRENVIWRWWWWWRWRVMMTYGRRWIGMTEST